MAKAAVGWERTVNSDDRTVFECDNWSFTVSKLGRLVDTRTGRSGKGDWLKPRGRPDGTWINCWPGLSYRGGSLSVPSEPSARKKNEHTNI